MQPDLLFSAVSGYMPDPLREKWLPPVFWHSDFYKEMPSVHRLEESQTGFFQLGSIDGPTVSGKADKETGNDIFVGDLTGRAFQNLLAAVADGDQAAFSRTLCPEGKTVDLLFKLTGQIITESNFCNRILQIFFRKTGSFMRNPDADMRGRGKRISLNMVNR